MASTANAGQKIAPTRRAMLQRFLNAIEAFHATEQSLEGVDPATGEAFTPAARTTVIEAATMRLTTEFHAAIDTSWRSASSEAMQSLWGNTPEQAPAQAARVLESEIARQNEFASRFAMDVARGETEEKRKIPEPTRAAMYADAAEAGYQTAASLGSPDGTLIWWRLGEAVKSCHICPTIEGSSPYTRESLPTTPRAGSTPCVFTPESPVLTRRGLVPICEVEAGDEVWTHRSRWRRVLNAYVNPSNGRSGVVINGVGFTESHKVWTVDGWIRAGDVARSGLHMLHCGHAKELHEMLGPDALGSSYQRLPTVRELLSVRNTEGPASDCLQVVRDEHEGQGAVEVRRGSCSTNGERPNGLGMPDDVGRPDMAQLHMHRREWAQVRQIPGRGEGHEPNHPQISVGVDNGQWADPAANAHPPHQRGPNGRPSGEPPGAQSRGPSQRALRPADNHKPNDGNVPDMPAPVQHQGNWERQATREILRQGMLASVAASELDARNAMRNVRDVVRVPAAQGTPTEVLFVQVLPAHVYDLEVEEDHSFLVGGIFAENCRSNCKCFLEFTLAQGVSPPLTPEEKQSGRRFEERIVNPPPLPPGLRLPTPEERGVMRDREIQLNFARRKAADAEAAGRKDEAKLWYRKRKELNAEAIAYNKERGIHGVPTFSVGDVINGKDIGQRDIDRLTHFRGIDGVTISRAQVAAIHEATAAAKKDVLAVLKDYPQADPVSREEWRRLLRENGAPASAFGGDLTRLATEAHGHQHDAAPAFSARPVLDELRAIEAAVPTVSDATLPSPADVIVVNIVGESARETLENHSVALATLGAAGRRTGVAPYRVEVGPFDDAWETFVVSAGTWVQGERDEVLRFLSALRGGAAPFAVATWQPMG